MRCPGGRREPLSEPTAAQAIQTKDIKAPLWKKIVYWGKIKGQIKMEQWHDQKEPKVFQANIPEIAKGRKRIVAMTVGKCAISLYRHRPEVNHLLVLEEDHEGFTRFYDLHQLYIYMGGVALNSEDEKIKADLYHSAGDFQQKYRWRPPVVIHDYPDEEDIECYFNAHSTPLEKLHDDLKQALREDFQDDGA
jgi:hypothetical protein